MIEFVYRPSRRKSGKKVVSHYWYGCYSLGRGKKPIRVSLGTKDKIVAQKKLRDIVQQAEREALGLTVPKLQRDVLTTPIASLIGEYKADLQARELSADYVSDTTFRIQRIFNEAKWSTLADVNAKGFMAWRAALQRSAKTKKEYQGSVLAFLTWLEKADMLAKNPLKKLTRVETRGKFVRESRAFTQDEIRRLLAAAPDRRVQYLFLLYTGARKSEARFLVWGDIELGERPFVRFRVTMTKDKDTRVVPLHLQLAAELVAWKGAAKRTQPSARVFPSFVSWDTLRVCKKIT
jgi:integrase